MGGATRGRTAEPTSRDQNKKARTGQGEEYDTKNGGGEAEQSGTSCDRAKGGMEHVRVGWRSQLPRTTYGRWQGIGRTGLDGH